MDDPNITMEEYIRLEDEMVQSRGETFNWQTATFGRTRYYYEEERFMNFEEEFPAIVFWKINAIVFNNTSDTTPPCEPTVSPPNENKNDFIISLDESDDEDYTNEFPAIVYNDGLTSKSDFRTEPTVCPQHIDEFDLKDETSLSECNEKEQNVLYFNDLFPFKVIYPDDLKSNTDNDNDEIDIEKPLGDMSVILSPNVYIDIPLSVPIKLGPVTKYRTISYFWITTAGANFSQELTSDLLADSNTILALCLCRNVCNSLSAYRECSGRLSDSLRTV
ncbi:hypothetical protein Tco_0871081 [Tanacetum coccineum]